MVNLTSTIHRRGFLGGLAAAAATLGIAGLASPLTLEAQQKSKPGGSTDASFDSWLNRIKGKHKQVFDATRENEGMAFAWSRVFMMTNKSVGVSDSDVTSVIILRHDAIPLALDHPLWEKYKFGEFYKIHDKATKDPALRNPYYKPKQGELMLDSFAIDSLISDGVLFGACDMALTVYSGIFAKNMNMDAAEVKKEWVAGLLPGMHVVPSGVLAVNRAQEHGCTYCFAG
jgi:intracellular sulfur oxidation DsrE/DsrF family protein